MLLWISRSSVAAIPQQFASAHEYSGPGLRLVLLGASMQHVGHWTVYLRSRSVAIHQHFARQEMQQILKRPSAGQIPAHRVAGAP